MVELSQRTALLVIDVQKGFDDPVWGARNNPGAEEGISRLLAAWRRRGRPIFHAQHRSTEPRSPLRPGQDGCEIKESARPTPSEPVIPKSAHSAFIGTDLESRLREAGVDAVVIVGLTTNHCVSTTARMASDLGFDTYVVADATATFERVGPDGRHYPAGWVHELALVSLHEEFATVLSTRDLLGDAEG